jgi:hypothetical protein
MRVVNDTRKHQTYADPQLLLWMRAPTEAECGNRRVDRSSGSHSELPSDEMSSKASLAFFASPSYYARCKQSSAPCHVFSLF